MAEKIKVILSIDSLAQRCGYFYNGGQSEDAPLVNNGYNCNHPNCEEEEDGIGCCLPSACPIAYRSNGDLCQQCGVECVWAGDEDCPACDNDLMVAEIPATEFNENKMWRVDSQEV